MSERTGRDGNKGTEDDSFGSSLVRGKTSGESQQTKTLGEGWAEEQLALPIYTLAGFVMEADAVTKPRDIFE